MRLEYVLACFSMGYRKKPLPVEGDRFGALVVRELGLPGRVGASRQVLVRCDCGTEKWVLLSNLERHTRSCGCLRPQMISAANTKHGQTKTRLYRIWSSMKNRCYNPRVPDYSKYGAKGITVCQAWRESFIAFRDWAEASGYHDGLEIDRQDNAKGYWPNNCRWVNDSEQRLNQRRVVILMAFGEEKSVAEWGRDPRCAVSYSTFRKRIQVGWAPERALTTVNSGGQGCLQR